MAEKNPEEEIVQQAEYPWLIFGNGLVALYYGGTNYVDEQTGIEYIDALIKPEAALRKKYRIADTEFNKLGQIHYKLKSNNITILNQLDPANNKILYDLTYDGQETDLSRRYNILLKRLEAKEFYIIAIQGELMKMSEDYILAKQNPEEFVERALQLADKMQSMSMTNMAGFGVKQPGAPV